MHFLVRGLQTGRGRILAVTGILEAVPPDLVSQVRSTEVITHAMRVLSQSMENVSVLCRIDVPVGLWRPATGGGPQPGSIVRQEHGFVGKRRPPPQSLTNRGGVAETLERENIDKR